MSAAALTQRAQPPASTPSPPPNPTNSLHSQKNKPSSLRPRRSHSPPSSISPAASPQLSQLSHVSFPVSPPTLSPPPYSHHPSLHLQHQLHHHSQLPHPLASSFSSPCPSPPPSPLTLPPSASSNSARPLLSSSASRPPHSPGRCPPYLVELAQAARRTGSGLIREPSLPSIMSLPRTRPASPDHPPSLRTSFPRRRPNLPVNTPGRSSSPASPHLARRFFTPGAGHALSSLRTFEEGLQHYERVRSPSLRGHSRRGSWSNLPQDGPVSVRAESEMFELDLSEDIGEETLRQVKLSDDEDFLSGSDGEDDHAQTRKVFRVGERVGVGTLHQGYRVRDLFETGPGDGRRLSMAGIGDRSGSGLLEIVRQIGVGSYAVVYLVREVLYDPDLDAEPTPADSTLSQTPKASDGFASLSTLETVAPRRKRRACEVVYGRDFALKCLCKRNLSDELLVLQRGEAELHRSLPLHDNIVALHRALETPNWLFLVIEYCPGQDLFYWLEQARDSQDLESLASRTNSFARNFPSSTHSSTHMIPHPIQERGTDSCMQSQVPQAGPNTPPSPSLLASTADDEMLSRRRLRLISRMFVQMCEAVEACHQAGVCHRDIKPENFIVVDDRKGRTGDEPPSGRSSVTVKITDWGLGTSSKACEDFDCGSKPYMAYECRNNLNPTYDPVQADVWSLGIVLLNLLYHRCPWADPTGSDGDFLEFRRAPAAFFRDRFEGMTPAVATFLAQRVFCEVGPGSDQCRVSAGQFAEWVKNLLHHMGGGQLHASVSDATIVMSPSSARGGIEQRRSAQGSSTGRLSKRSSQLFQSITFPDAVPEDPSPTESQESGSEKLFLNVNEQAPPSLANIKTGLKDFDEPTEILMGEVNKDEHGEMVSVGVTEGGVEDNDSCTSGGGGGKMCLDKQRRRKRGARKGRRADGQRLGTETAPTSPVLGPLQVDMLDGLAEASQSLAREISQATKTMKTGDEGGQAGPTVKRKMNLAERMMEKFRDGSNADMQAFVARARAREAALMGKVNSTTASAPAQLQDCKQDCGRRHGGGRETVSTGSSGMGTTMSSTSWGGGSECTSSSCNKAAHWSSASHRRERLQKTNPHLVAPALPPVTVGNGPSPSRKETPSTTKTGNPPHQSNKKDESKNKLAMLLTSFKRFNSTVGNHHSSSSAASSTVLSSSATVASTGALAGSTTTAITTTTAGSTTNTALTAPYIATTTTGNLHHFATTADNP